MRLQILLVLSIGLVGLSVEASAAAKSTGGTPARVTAPSPAPQRRPPVPAAVRRPVAPAARPAAIVAPEPKFDFQLRDVPFRVALDQLFRGTGRQYAVEAQIPEVPITVTLKDVDFATALRTLTLLARATYWRDGPVYVIGAAAPPAPSRRAAPAPALTNQPLSVDLDKVPFRKAVDQLFQGSGREYALTPDMPDTPVTLRLSNAGFLVALESLVRLAGATYRQEGNLFVISPERARGAAAAPAVEPPDAAPEAADADDVRVELSLDRVPFLLALETLFTQVGAKYKLEGSVENLPVTINVRSTDLGTALRGLTRLVGATYEKVGDTYVIRGRRR